MIPRCMESYHVEKYTEKDIKLQCNNFGGTFTGYNLTNLTKGLYHVVRKRLMTSKYVQIIIFSYDF